MQRVPGGDVWKHHSGQFPALQLVKYEPAFLLADTQVRIGERLDQVELKMVGEGAFAIVYKYKDPEYGIPFALKRAKQGLEEKDLVRFRREFDLLKDLRFPYVLEVYRYNDERQSFIFSGRKDITACSGAVRSIIDRCVAHDLVARYPDVLTIIRDVEALEPATADPISDTPA